MVTLWQELDQCYEDVWENANDCARFKKREENDRVYMFLASVNFNLDDVKGRILGRKPLPSTHEVFSMVIQEECRKRIMLSKSMSNNHSETDSSALVSHGPDNKGDKKKRQWCNHYKRPWHMRETCWKLMER